MARMKDCGVKWIGCIPEEWEVKRGKYFFDFINGFAFDSEDLKTEGKFPVVRIGDIQDGMIVFENCLYISENKGLEQYKINKGDLLLAMSGATVGKVGIMDEEIVAYINQRVGIIRNNVVRYIYYVLSTTSFLEYIELESVGSAQPNISSEGIKKFLIPCPNYKEQKYIADFLDKEVKKIDDILKDLNNEIGLLDKYKKILITEVITKGLNSNAEMKESEIDWIGTMPKHWNIQRMQDIGDYKKGPFGSAITLDMFVDKGENTYKVYEQKNAINHDEKLGWYYIEENDFKLLKDFEVSPNDIIVSCAGTIGKCHIMPATMERGIINQALMRITLNKNVNNYYFLYLFDVVLEKISEKYSNGSAIKNIPPFSILKKYKICTPPIEEQEKIAQYLNKKCQEIEKLILDKQKQIEKMEKYKKSLIYEYVTGKKRVKGAEELYG